MVKKTCKNRLTALIKTASRYNHASPDILLGQTLQTILAIRLFNDQAKFSALLASQKVVDRGRAELEAWAGRVEGKGGGVVRAG
jgi:hypothetical protein